MYKFITAFILLSTFFVGQGFAIVIRVPEDYPTIQQGIDAASAGDIVLVAQGTYPEEITLKADVVVKGAGEGLSIIDGGNDPGDVVTAVGNDITNTTKLQGFTITGASNSGSMPGGGGIFCNSGAAPEICNNRVEGNDQGIAMWNQSAAFLHNNVVVDNTYTVISVSSDSNIVNNTIANNNIGIYDSGGYLPTVMNNIVTGNTTYGIGCVNSSVPTNFSYNDVWNNGQNYYNCSAGPNSFSLDPLYVDEPNGDYHLQPGSPCIDSGNPLPQYNDPDGSRNDMGAYGGPGAPADFPLVELTIPSQNELNVAHDIDVSAMFNIDMNSGTFTPTTCILSSHQTGMVLTTITYDSTARMVTIDPAENFRSGAIMTALLTKDILSHQGDSLEGFIWQFTSQVDSGSGIFSLTSNYPTGNAPHSVIIGDFDSDNNFDLCVTNENTNDVSVYMGNGDGTFALATNYGVGTNPHALCTYDFNADGNLDLATANGSDSVSILLGNGDGSFGVVVDYSADNDAMGVCGGDVNADGHVDLAVANFLSHTISILIGNGDGSFNAPVQHSVGTNPRSVCAGDFDGDGYLDLAAVNQNSNNVSILLGGGDGGFGTATHYTVGSSPYSICTGDFNEDGNLDLATANSASNNISRLLGNGDGTFGSALNYTVGDTPTSISTSDFNGDGNLDLAVTNSVSNNVSLLLGNGNGTFDSATNYPAGNSPFTVAAGDFDNDFDIDLTVTNNSTNNVSILLNESALLVINTDPTQHQLDASKSTDVATTFNIEVDPITINDSTFIVFGAQSGPHPGAIDYNSGTYTATLDPSADFIDGEIVTALLTKEIQSTIGVFLRGFAWNFTVEVTSPSDAVFGNPMNFSIGNEPRGMYAADFDTDGDIDIASTSNPYSIAVILNNGDGTFSSPAYTTVQGDPIALYGADLDSDGDIDLASAHNEPGTSHLVILKNNGSGAFSVFATYAPAILGQNITGGDFDADGDVDLIMTDGWGSGDNVRVMFNNGNGAFSGPYTYSAGTWARGVVAVDVDNDGDIDIAVSNAGNDNISILFNDGEGNFSDLSNYSVGEYPTAVYGNDLNADGSVDLATANYSGNNITVILNIGDGTFTSPTGYMTGTYTRFIHGGDFDGDGDIDLVGSINGGDSVSVILNNGDGTFVDCTQYGVGDSPWGVQSADFNLDGALDVACGNYNSDNVTILYNMVVGVAESREYSVAPFLRISPNPFRHKTEIRFQLLNARDCELKIYDATGRLIKQFNRLTNHQSLINQVSWDGTDDLKREVPNGVYFCRIKSEDLTMTKQIILIK
ncbi:MAG: VCBS repeat-containing protein [candidate division WOR-3 bacterium]|nr:MAG: VCBS repeat-containing protein [candidate division WOR-3 bacterium]